MIIRNLKGQFVKGHKVNLGRKHTKTTKEKISESHKGKPAWNKGKQGIHLSPKTEFKQGHKVPKGKDSWAWKGGVSPENKRIRVSVEFRLWREAVFARDNWTCQKYGIKGGKLHPHHIKNFADYPKLRFAIDNGITFSEKAHREFHRKYGKKNNTIKQLKEFLDR